MRQMLRSARLFLVDAPVDADLGLTRFIADWIGRYGWEPVFLFRNVLLPGPTPRPSAFPVVMNLWAETAVLERLGCPFETAGTMALARRLAAGRGTVRWGPAMATAAAGHLHDLPVLRHQPREAGPYLTSFVAALRDPQSGTVNLGIYRALVAGPNRLVIFFDPRTDAYAIVQRYRALGEEAPVALFTGGPPAVFLAAVAALPPDIDSFTAASHLSDEPISLADPGGGYPPVPADAEIVLLGRVLNEQATEAPFGEFKGYYAAPTSSPVILVDTVRHRDDAWYPGLFCGKESGLALEKVQNETMMAAHLMRCGFPVGRVRFPMDGFGEFIVEIETPEPSRSLLDCAMSCNRRAKIFVVSRSINNIGRTLSTFGITAHTEPYVKRGFVEGHRLGLLVDDARIYDWVEY